MPSIRRQLYSTMVVISMWSKARSMSDAYDIAPRRGSALLEPIGLLYSLSSTYPIEPAAFRERWRIGVYHTTEQVANATFVE